MKMKAKRKPAKTKFKIQKTPSGLKIDLPHNYSDVSSYYAESIDEDPEGLVRLVRVDIVTRKRNNRTDNNYALRQAAYRKFSDLLGKRQVPYWESIFTGITPRNNPLGFKFHQNTKEYQAFELLYQEQLKRNKY